MCMCSVITGVLAESVIAATTNNLRIAAEGKLPRKVLLPYHWCWRDSRGGHYHLYYVYVHVQQRRLPLFSLIPSHGCDSLGAPAQTDATVARARIKPLRVACTVSTWLSFSSVLHIFFATIHANKAVPFQTVINVEWPRLMVTV